MISFTLTQRTRRYKTLCTQINSFCDRNCRTRVSFHFLNFTWASLTRYIPPYLLPWATAQYRLTYNFPNYNPGMASPTYVQLFWIMTIWNYYINKGLKDLAWKLLQLFGRWSLFKDTFANHVEKKTQLLENNSCYIQQNVHHQVNFISVFNRTWIWLTILQCSDSKDRCTVWSISFHCWCKYCDIVKHILSQPCYVHRTNISTSHLFSIVILCLWLVPNCVLSDDAILFLTLHWLPWYWNAGWVDTLSSHILWSTIRF